MIGITLLRCAPLNIYKFCLFMYLKNNTDIICSHFQHVLPLVIDGCLTPSIRNIIYRLGSFARWISTKEISIAKLRDRKREVIELVCLELPISFFDIQVHLLIHLVDEIELAGVVSTRWMFWVERFMCVLKKFVRQRARPEGSMAEGWLYKECMYYLSEYLQSSHEDAPLSWTHDESTTMSKEVLLAKEYQFVYHMRSKSNIYTN